ncbi:MAG: rod-binding protein [Pseudomonadota bacterium]
MDRIALTPINSAVGTAFQPSSEDKALREAAQKLEAVFLSEMLKAAKFGETPSTMGGGVGEDQFASFLRDAHARSVAQTGVLGLAESLFNAMKEAGDVE